MLCKQDVNMRSSLHSFQCIRPGIYSVSIQEQIVTSVCGSADWHSILHIYSGRYPIKGR